MKVTVNSKIEETENGETAASLKNRIKPEADIIIINGFPAENELLIKEGDDIVLIKKGKTPPIKELEYMLTSRHAPGVYEKLRKASVAVAGLGGLGSNAAVTLARMGIGRLKLVDFDIVEPSNLNRQHYFVSQIGMKKTDALKATIENVNPFVKTETEDVYVNADNIERLFSGFDVILECFDKSDVKAEFVSEVLKRLPEVFLIGASGIAGVYSHELFKTVKLGKRCLIIGDFSNEAAPGAGLMASRVSIASNIQANIAVRHILGEKDG